MDSSFYCLTNLVFSSNRTFYLLEEFVYLVLMNEINCDYIYLSREMFSCYEKFFQINGTKSQSFDINSFSLDIEKTFENQFKDSKEAFHKNKRKFYDEFLNLIENKYDEYFPICTKIKHFIEFSIKSKIVKAENLAAFIYLKEKNFIIESGKNFGFDFLLYRKTGDEKDFHLHAPYAVSLLNADSKLLYYEMLGKLRIVKNYSKVNLIDFD